jgi:hypothetical protein
MSDDTQTPDDENVTPIRPGIEPQNVQEEEDEVPSASTYHIVYLDHVNNDKHLIATGYLMLAEGCLVIHRRDWRTLAVIPQSRVISAVVSSGEGSEDVNGLDEYNALGF